jgi:hypothetical protein
VKENNMIRAALSLILFGVIFSPSVLTACGDKYFVPSRGMVLQGRLVDRAAAKILIYAVPGSTLEITLTALAVESRLRRAGYQPTYVTSSSSFSNALANGAWDVVVVDLAEGLALLDRVPAAHVNGILPVAAAGTTKDTLASAKKRFSQVLKAPGKDWVFLEAVDRTVVTRARAARKAGNRSGN